MMPEPPLPDVIALVGFEDVVDAALATFRDAIIEQHEQVLHERASELRKKVAELQRELDAQCNMKRNGDGGSPEVKAPLSSKLEIVDLDGTPRRNVLTRVPTQQAKVAACVSGAPSGQVKQKAKVAADDDSTDDPPIPPEIPSAQVQLVRKVTPFLPMGHQVDKEDEFNTFLTKAEESAALNEVKANGGTTTGSNWRRNSVQDRNSDSWDAVTCAVRNCPSSRERMSVKSVQSMEFASGLANNGMKFSSLAAGGKGWKDRNSISGHRDAEPFGRKSTRNNTNDTTLRECLSSGLAKQRQMIQAGSLCGRIRKDPDLQASFFDMVMGGVIILNTITIGLSCDIGRTWDGWLYVDAAFAALFSFEAAAKMFVNGMSAFFAGPKRNWNVFELILVMFAVLEVTLSFVQKMQPVGARDGVLDLNLFRVLRLIRITRVLRVCRLQVFGELMMMINGAIGGVRTLGWAIVLISVPIYMAGLVLRETLGNSAGDGDGAESFADLGQAMFTIFRCVVGGECSQRDGKPIFVLVSSSYGWGFGALYIVVMILMYFGLFNVITAIFVENTVAAAKTKERKEKWKNLTTTTQCLVQAMWNQYCLWKGRKVKIVFEDDLDEMLQMEITQDFWEEMCNNFQFQDFLRDLDIADEDRQDLFNILDVDGGGTIDLEELVTGIGLLRGDPRRSDILQLNILVRTTMQTCKDFFEEMTDAMISQHCVLVDILQTVCPKSTDMLPKTPSFASVRGCRPTKSPTLSRLDSRASGL